MTKICFIAPWGDPTSLLNRFKNQTPNSSGVWNSIKGVDNPDEADCIVALDTIGFHGICKKLNVKNLKDYSVIHFRREPDFINSFHPIPDSSFFDYQGSTFHVATWWISNSYDDILNLNYFDKPKLLSSVVSAKWKHRNLFFKKISNLLNMDVYGGHGVKEYAGKNYMYPVAGFKNKECGIKDYKYSIAIENSSQENYFTEKIIDCLLLWSIPIYWGCPNISSFFPEHSFYNIELENPEEIHSIIERPIEKKNIEAMKEARDLILNKYNIWAVIESLL